MHHKHITYTHTIMKQKLLTALLFAALCLHTASAQIATPNLKWGKPTDVELNMTEYAADKEAKAVVLCHLTTVNYKMDLYNYTVDYQVKKRIKILADDGKDFANITIPFISNGKEDMLESIEDFKATAFNVVNGKVVKTKIGREAIHEERINEDFMRAKVAIPQAKAGTIIEYEFTRHSNVFFHIFDWEAQEEIPVVFAQYRLEIPAYFVFNVETSGIYKLEAAHSVGSLTFQPSSDNMTRAATCKTNVYLCTGRNLPALKKDDYVWSERDYLTKVTAELKSYATGSGNYRETRKTWEQVDDILAKHSDFGARLSEHSKYRDELTAAGIPAMTDVKEKVAATLTMLRKKLAWNGDYDVMAHSASEVIKKGNGTSGDLNMILLNMLNDAGVQACPMVLSTRRHGRLPQTYPSLDKLNTFVVAVPNGSSWLYVDATTPDGYVNVLDPNLYVEQARLIQKGKPSQWVNLQKVGEARTQVTVDAAISAAGVMTGEQTAIYTGNAALSERRAFREAGDSAAFVAKKAEGYGVEISSCEMTGHKGFMPAVNEVIKFSKQGEAASDHIYINPFTAFPLRTNPLLETERLLPVELPCRQSFSMTMRLALPEGWSLEELPKSTRITSEDKSMSAQVTYNLTGERQLSVQVQFRMANVIYANNKYKTLREMFDQLASRSKDMLVLKKN
ncbi:protein of unknown function [Prevotellaceae bacterium HUN156]|nr:protein of unknown function [Prevotellaceae bacterium HUN156]